MDWNDITIKTSDVPCNCRWIQCPAHPDSLCVQMAAYVDNCPDPECRNTHFLGDRALGENVHICKLCANALFDIFIEEVLELMSEVSKFVPPYLKFLEGFLREVYKSRCSGHGWELPQNDALALMGFAVIVLLENKAPLDLLQRTESTTNKLSEIYNAYQPASIPKGVEA